MPDSHDSGHTTFSAWNVLINKSIVESQVASIRLASFLVSHGKPDICDSAYETVESCPSFKIRTSFPLTGSNENPSSSLNFLAISVKSEVPSSENYFPLHPPLKQAESTPKRIEYFLSIV